MAYKKKYAATALAGLVLVSFAGWWFMNRQADKISGPAGATAAAGAASSAASGPTSGPVRPAAVEVARVATMTLIDETQATGSLRSRQGVVLRPEVGGRVRQILFEDGQRVRKGQLLVQLDDQLQQAQLAQARAELSIAQANHKRNQELVAQNFVSQRSVDETSAALEVAQAKLALADATLQRFKLLAPFDGVTGLRLVNVGDYLKDGTDIVNIEDMDALLVDFRLPERFQSRVRAGQQAQLNADALPGRPFTAVIQAVDPLIDANGRSVGVRGCIDNRTRQWRPGMFVRVNAVFGQRDNALVVPEEAIVPQAGRTFVVKVVAGEKPGELVSQRQAVRTGLRLPGKVEILEGLSADDTVVTAGHQRLQRDGSPVRVVDMGRSAAPAAGPASVAASSPAPLPSPVAQRPIADGPRKGGASAPARTAVPAGPNPCLRG